MEGGSAGDGSRVEIPMIAAGALFLICRCNSVWPAAGFTHASLRSVETLIDSTERWIKPGSVRRS
jgi:hypothetical protein